MEIKIYKARDPKSPTKVEFDFGEVTMTIKEYYLSPKDTDSDLCMDFLKAAHDITKVNRRLKEYIMDDIVSTFELTKNDLIAKLARMQ